MLRQLQIYGFQISKNIGPAQVLWGISYHGQSIIINNFQHSSVAYELLCISRETYVSFFLYFNLIEKDQNSIVHPHPGHKNTFNFTPPPLSHSYYGNYNKYSVKKSFTLEIAVV